MFISPKKIEQVKSYLDMIDLKFFLFYLFGAYYKWLNLLVSLWFHLLHPDSAEVKGGISRNMIMVFIKEGNPRNDVDHG